MSAVILAFPKRNKVPTLSFYEAAVIDMPKPLPNLPEDDRQRLLDDLNAEIASMREYRLSEESSEAEYCQTGGYGDGELDLDDLDDDLAALVEQLRALVPADDIRRHLLECSELRQVGIYREDNEIYSVLIGECEETVSDEMATRLKALSDDDYEWIRRQADGYLQERGRSCAHEYVYLNLDYERWVMVLDQDLLEERLADLQPARESAQ